VETQDLLGVWKPQTMSAPGTPVYDVLVIKEDGSGFLDFSDPETEYFCEEFRWSIASTGRLWLRGERVRQFNAGRTGVVERESRLDAGVSFSIRTEHGKVGRHAQVLRMGTCPWSALSNHSRVATRRYQCHAATYATFQAPCFSLEEEGTSVFRGKALSEYLAQQLERCRLRVGPMMEVFMGCCYHRDVQFSGQQLGLAVNWDRDLQEWWLRVSPPPLGGKVESQELVILLDDILKRVGGLHDLQWHTEEGWVDRSRHSRGK